VTPPRCPWRAGVLLLSWSKPDSNFGGGGSANRSSSGLFRCTGQPVDGTAAAASGQTSALIESRRWTFPRKRNLAVAHLLYRVVQRGLPQGGRVERCGLDTAVALISSLRRLVRRISRWGTSLQRAALGSIRESSDSRHDRRFPRAHSTLSRGATEHSRRRKPRVDARQLVRAVLSSGA